MNSSSSPSPGDENAPQAGHSLPATDAPRPARKVLIGSQRDAADPALRASKPVPPPAPATGTADRTAPAEWQRPASLSGAPEPAPAPDAQPVPAPPLSTTEVSAAAPAPSRENEDLLRVASRSMAIDRELEAALDQLQPDLLMGNPAEPIDIEADTRVRGIVTRIHNENVFFSLKGHYQGVASLRQFREPPREGAMIDVVVTAFREEEGLYEVTVPGAAMNVGDWSDLAEGSVVEARITGSNTGGLECSVNQLRGFIPASQIAIGHVENFGDFVNQKMTCVVTEVNPARRKLVLSRRAILEREAQSRRQELLQTLRPGDVMDGVVTKLMDFGAFVDLGGVEGLVHVSKLSWDRVSHPKEVLQPGQRIRVKIEKIAEGTGKIGLSLRDTAASPWSSIEEKYPVGSTVSGTVSRIAQFGAFVKLEPGIEGLVHISELAHHRVIAVKNVVKEGEPVNVKVLSVDKDSQKIGLSLKATQARPEAEPASKRDEPDEPVRETAVKGTGQPLKGGRGRSAGGDQFGLNW